MKLICQSTGSQFSSVFWIWSGLVEELWISKALAKHLTKTQPFIKTACNSIVIQRFVQGKHWKEGRVSRELHHLIKTKVPKVVITETGPMLEYQQNRLFRVMEDYIEGSGPGAILCRRLGCSVWDVSTSLIVEPGMEGVMHEHYIKDMVLRLSPILKDKLRAETILKNYWSNKMAVVWEVEDVHRAANEREVALTRKEAIDLLRDLHHSPQPSIRY